VDGDDSPHAGDDSGEHGAIFAGKGVRPASAFKKTAETAPALLKDSESAEHD
jgi:hypothetical protein